MGWYTYSTLETDEEWQFIISVSKTKVAKVKREVAKVKRAVSIYRVALYTGDVATDCYTVYKFYSYGFSPYWQLSLIFILSPMILTLFATLVDVITNPSRTLWAKILLVPIVIVCFLFIPLYYLILDSYDSFRTTPNRNAERKSQQARMNEGLLEALPQAMIQVTLILGSVYSIRGVQAWQIVSLTLSVISFCFTVSSSYLFDTTIKTRLVFFGCGLVAVTSRLMAGALLSLEPTAIVLVLISIIIWSVKRCCIADCSYGCCWHCAPLANSHRQCSTMDGILHVPITWLVTAYANCYTGSGFILSTFTMAWSLLRAIYIYIPDSPHATYYITGVTLSTITFLLNLMFVCVPKYRRRFGDAWLNKCTTDEEEGQGHTQLY